MKNSNGIQISEEDRARLLRRLPPQDYHVDMMTCPECNGSGEGRRDGRACSRCKGDCEIPRDY